MNNQELEEGSELSVDFTKIFQIAEGNNMVVPVVVQDAVTKDVLIVAYVNEVSRGAAWPKVPLFSNS